MLRHNSNYAIEAFSKLESQSHFFRVCSFTIKTVLIIIDITNCFLQQ